MKDIKLDLYRSPDPRWHWKVRRHGRSIAHGDLEGYVRRIDCLAAAGRLLGFDHRAIDWLPDAPNRSEAWSYGQARIDERRVVEINLWHYWIAEVR